MSHPFFNFPFLTLPMDSLCPALVWVSSGMESRPNKTIVLLRNIHRFFTFMFRVTVVSTKRFDRSVLSSVLSASPLVMCKVFFTGFNRTRFDRSAHGVIPAVEVAK